MGPMDEELKAIDGTELLGFVMPKDLPGVLQDAGCLLLPSRFETWGVVVHEAIASGLAVICTNRVVPRPAWSTTGTTVE